MSFNGFKRVISGFQMVFVGIFLFMEDFWFIVWLYTSFFCSEYDLFWLSLVYFSGAYPSFFYMIRLGFYLTLSSPEFSFFFFLNCAQNAHIRVALYFSVALTSRLLNVRFGELGKVLSTDGGLHQTLISLKERLAITLESIEEKQSLLNKTLHVGTQPAAYFLSQKSNLH